MHPTTVVAAAADMIFASRIRGAGQAAGIGVRLAGSGKALLEAAAEPGVRLILIDLDHRSLKVAEVIRELKAGPTSAVPVVGFVSHVNEGAIREARAAGADRVLARSRFVQELPELLKAASETA